MYNFQQSNLRIGVAYTRRDLWINSQTQKNKTEIASKVSSIFEEDSVEMFSSDDLPSERRRLMVNGREITSSNNGFLSNYEDAVRLAEYFRKKEIDALFIGFCNYGQEDAIAKLAKELNVPVFLWGPRDLIPDPELTYRPTDTQCGIFAASKVLRRYGVTFTYVENCNIDAPLFSKGVRSFLDTVRIIKNFKKGRIAQISVRPQQFANLMVNEGELLERFGIEIVPITGAELLDTIKLIEKKEKENIEYLLQDIEQTIELSKVPDKRKMAAIELGFMKIAHRYGCNAIASDCWHEVRREFGFGPWFIFGDLYDRGLPCTNECDIHGAITSLMAIGVLNNKSAAFLSDLTMRNPLDDNSELLWHMGFAKQLKAKNEKALVLKTGEGNYRLKEGELTLLRFDGDNGEYYGFVGRGSSVAGPSTGGNYTYLKVENWSKWEKKFVYGPYVHHVVGMYGNYELAFKEAFRYLGIKSDGPNEPLFT
jgi:L-fucose isomerase-like protein